MKTAGAVIAATLLFALAAPDTGASLPRQCKHGCRDAVHYCMDNGMRRVRCQRAYWRACRQAGVEACSVGTPTTTTVPTMATTTTTIPPTHGAIQMGIQTRARLDRDSMFCAFQVVVTGVGNSPVALDPHHFYVVGTDGVRYDPFVGHMMGGMMHSCSEDDVVLPDHTIVCSLRFMMPLWVTGGDLWFDDAGYRDHMPFNF